MNTRELQVLSCAVRRSVLEMTHRSGSSHVASSLSVVDLLVFLYGGWMLHLPNEPDFPERDRLLLSKGHACAALYATLAEFGYFQRELLETFARDGSMLMSHVSSEVPGVEFSTGSLGHALPVAAGMALIAKRRNEPQHIYVVLSDGELNEGSNWEALLFAAQHNLDNLMIIIDRNGLQGLGAAEAVCGTEPIGTKLESFGWSVVRTNGHDYDALRRSIEHLSVQQRPACLIADTIKGKGISFMENNNQWHYKSPNAEQLQAALAELEEYHAHNIR